MATKVERAIAVAMELHKGQVRKGDGKTPYIVHPVAVALVLSKYTDDEDTICAAILHDVLEDTNYKTNQLKRAFGPRVLGLVSEVTDKRPKDPWNKRKVAYLAHIKDASMEACLIACADKINNLRSISDAYKKRGESIWERFNAPKEAKLGFYGDIYKEVRKRFSHPIINELGKALREMKKAVKM